VSDDDFEPKLSGKRIKNGKKAVRYAGRIIAATRLAGTVSGVRARRFDGSRIGRGASMGRLLSSRDRLAGFRSRRAIVKTRLVRLGPKGVGTARAHLRYIQRDGVTREGNPGELYSADQDTANGTAFLDRADGDRHQFRFIVSAEDGAEYADLKPYVRRLMAQVEVDLGTKLDWVAVDHFNTERPHTHIMLRGVDDQGQNLVIAREYISHGFRERAAELVTLDLGPRTTQEIEERLRHDVDQERLTAIDRRLLRRMDADRLVTAADRDPFQQSLAVGRLRKLVVMGLAEDIGAGRYQIADGLEETLRRMGERGDIIRTMQRELTARRLERSGGDLVVAPQVSEPILGQVVHRGFTDELKDRHYLIVDGVDGRAHYVDIGRDDGTEPTPESAMVRVHPRAVEIRDADRTVAAVAAAHEGRYSIDLHLRHDPTATEAFAETHVRRLEAMRRAGTGIERDAAGSWTIGADHLARAEAYEAAQVRDRPVTVEVVARSPIEQLARANAATWLDHELASGAPTPVRDSGFGSEVRGALAARRQWLIEQQLAEGDGAQVRMRANALLMLQRRELLREGARLSGELGKTFTESQSGDAIDGKLTRKIELVSGKFALVEKGRDFTLVPWRPALEKQIGNQVGGVMRGDGVNWRFGRGRSGPEVG
jgi:type IV secretory pathway VirD2 relaxase